MKRIRIWYQKTGRARYISHLDMNRCMQRAMKRAGIPAWHTEGFNPHIYLTFALPLSLGYESLCEIMDCKMEEDMPLEEIQNRLNSHLPPDIRVTKVALAQEKAEAIAFARYDLRLKREGVSPQELLERFEAFWGQERVVVTKKTKNRELEVDLKEHLQVGEREVRGEYLCFSLLAPAGGAFSVNPNLLTDSFFASFPGDFPVAHVTRTACLTGDGKDFQ